MASPLNKSPAPWVMKCKRNTLISRFLPQNYYTLGGGHDIYNFLSPFPTDTINQIWLRLAQ